MRPGPAQRLFASLTGCERRATDWRAALLRVRAGWLLAGLQLGAISAIRYARVSTRLIDIPPR